MPRSLVFSSMKNKVTRNAALLCTNYLRVQYAIGQQERMFGIVQEYNERKNKKLINNLLVNEENKFWVTSSRPSNFGDPIDTKTKVDNWFDENRLWNEENKDYDLKRA
jgi:hypothetical protein